MKTRNYILVSSESVNEGSVDVDYLSNVIRKTFPDYDWSVIYTEDIPIDGNVYLCYQEATKDLYKKLLDNKMITRKDIASKYIFNADTALCVLGFNYDLEQIKSTKEIKVSSYRYMRDVLEPILLDVVKSCSLLSEVKSEEVSPVETIVEKHVPDEVSAEIVETPMAEASPIVEVDSVEPTTVSLSVTEPVSNEDLSSVIKEFEFFIEDIIKQMLENKTFKVADKSLEVFEGIQIFSSKNPEHFITLANSNRKNYEHKILISELFIIIKAAKMIGSDSIKFSVK